MTAKSVGKPVANGTGKVFVFGVDDDSRPHAAWFPKAQGEAARAAAKQLRLNAVEVENGIAADLVTKVPAGRIHANGPGVVPTVPADLYENVIATINPRGEAGRAANDNVATDVPATWDAIKPGHVVLACESLIDGWWEAVVVDRTGDKLYLRWRDYPAQPKFTAKVTAVALFNPANP